MKGSPSSPYCYLRQSYRAIDARDNRWDFGKIFRILDHFQPAKAFGGSLRRGYCSVRFSCRGFLGCFFGNVPVRRFQGRTRSVCPILDSSYRDPRSICMHQAGLLEFFHYSMLAASQRSPASFEPIAPQAPYGLGSFERAPSIPSGGSRPASPASTELGMKRTLLSPKQT